MPISAKFFGTTVRVFMSRRRDGREKFFER
jgi:hypothetical protein